jgi:hypothetical protein
LIACNLLGGQHEVKPEAQLLQITVNPNAHLEAAAATCPSRFNTIATFFPFGFTASVVSLSLSSLHR